MLVYGFPVSPNSRRAELGLAEHGIAYDLISVDLAAGAQLRAEFRAKNPNGKVPVIEDGDFVLSESNAILLWLTDTRPEAGLGGADAIERAHIAKWMFFNAVHMAPSGAQIFGHTMLLPPARRVAQVAESARAELARCMGIVDAHLRPPPAKTPAPDSPEERGAGKTWMMGERFTIADIALAPNLYMAKTLLGADFAPVPALARWLEQMMARPAWKQVYGA
jgi:glutathione S-transferase